MSERQEVGKQKKIKVCVTKKFKCFICLQNSINGICFRTEPGELPLATYCFSCGTPMVGQYISLQRMLVEENMELAEFEVITASELPSGTTCP